MREGREVWERRVARWLEGGLPAEEYARELGISAQALLQWSSRMKRGKAASGVFRTKQSRRSSRSEPAGRPVGQSSGGR